MKTPHKGRRLNNFFQHPITEENSEGKQFLRYFLQWLDEWKSKPTTAQLTKETFTALSHATHALLEIADYCIKELGAKYVLLGKFQTDALEARFGKYRQLAGAKYDVSLRQVYECEKKLRVLSVLKLHAGKRNTVLSNFSTDWNDFSDEPQPIANFISLTPDDFLSIQDSLPVITYIAGYCCYSVVKRLRYSTRKEQLVCPVNNMENTLANYLIKGVSRGSFLYPSPRLLHIITVSYLAMNKICESEDFQSAPSQCNCLVLCSINLLDNEDFTLLEEVCENGQDDRKIVKMILWCCANIFLNNYCFKRNDNTLTARLTKKKKLQTLR